MRGHAFESACDTLRDMGYFGDPEPGDEDRDFKVLQDTAHVAKKAHRCDAGLTIEPGTRYHKLVVLQEGQFVIYMSCTGNICGPCQEKEFQLRTKAMGESCVEADQQASQEEVWEF
jgi:hypothetical protein